MFKIKQYNENYLVSPKSKSVAFYPTIGSIDYSVLSAKEWSPSINNQNN